MTRSGPTAGDGAFAGVRPRPDTNGGQRRALVVRGGWEGHAPVAASDRFIPFLKESDFDVTVTDDLDIYADAPSMVETDLIVQSWTTGAITQGQLRGLIHAVETGTGFAGWHGGIVDSFRDAVSYQQLVGAQFVAHPGGIRQHTLEVVPGRASHPIVQGVSTVTVQDEQYWVLADDLNDVLATTTIPAYPGDAWTRPITSPVVWTRQWGAGRIFVCTAGHLPAVLDLPDIRAVIERGMLWASR